MSTLILGRWLFRVRDPLGNNPREVDMTASRVDAPGMRFETLPHDTGRCTFEARPDGPALGWGDLLEIEVYQPGEASPTRLYRGEARVVGLPGDSELAQYELVSLSARLAETEMPELTLESMDAGAQVRAVIEALTATQVWGNAIFYDPQYVPNLGVTAPKLVATNFQLLNAYLDEMAGLVNGAQPDILPVVVGVNVGGYLVWGRNAGSTLDLRGRGDVAGTSWGQIVCENPCTRVRWFLKPFANLGATTAVSQHPLAATLGKRTVRQSLNALDVWESVTTLDNAPAGSPYSWGNVSPADRQKLQDGTASVVTTFEPESGVITGGFSITADDPWTYARFQGTVTPTGARIQLSVEAYDDRGVVGIQTAQLAAGQFDLTLPARTDLSLGSTGVRSNVNWEAKTGSTEPIKVVWTRAGYYAPDQERLDCLASAFYRLPDALVGEVELRTLEWPPPRQVTVMGPLGTGQTVNVTTEYVISASEYGHTHYKLGDPDPAAVRATAQLQGQRLLDAAAQALAVHARG